MDDQKQMRGPAQDCIKEIYEVMQRYDGQIMECDLIDLIGHFAMGFRDQRPFEAGKLLIEVGLVMTAGSGAKVNVDYMP